MNPLDILNAYLKQLESRMRVSALGRGAAVAGLCAVLATILLVLITNRFAFSELSVAWARAALFVILAFAIGFGVVLPLLRLNRRRAARAAENVYPGFEERLITFAEAKEDKGPFLELLADDALSRVHNAEPERVVTLGSILGFFATAAVMLVLMGWLTGGAPGFLGHGSSLLWAGGANRGDQPFYGIEVLPGDKTVRRGGDQLITAKLLGFQTERVRLFARFDSATKWEEVAMQAEPGGIGFEFLFGGVPEPVDYYVEAGAVRTEQFRLNVVDLPKVKSIQVTYRYPEWIGRADLVEEDGGDLRAIQGSEADLVIETDKPLEEGRLVLDDSTEITLTGREENRVFGTVRIERDGLYHVAALSQNERVRLSGDYFIEARQEEEPSIRIRRPGRDYRASPIEEVTLELEAADDYGLREMSLRYSVNGGPERRVDLLERTNVNEAGGETTLYLEEHKLVPGDLVSLYAVARDARTSSQTDMYFIEAQPFEREYSQSQQSGGGGGGGQEDQNRISPRQKEIISATWNEIKDKESHPSEAVENAAFLSEVQSTLREQAASLAQRMRARQLAMANEEFEGFADNMERAAEAMEEAAEKLSSLRWKEALVPEQKALQHLLRAESIFRRIQVARGGGGGGGGGNMGRDLENLFDLELDTEKNQYETGQRAALGEQRSKEIDEALQKLEELARRQQELAQQGNRSGQSFQQRWQQEMLRREAEELRRQMEQLAKRDTNELRRGRTGSRQQQGQTGQPGQAGRPGDQRLDQALERLRQATEDMRRASSSRNDGGPRDAESRRAAERLQEATELLSRLRRQESDSQLSGISERAERLARRQREFANELRETYKGHRALGGVPSLTEPKPPDPETVRELAREKQRMADDLRQLERDMQNAVRELAGTQKSASSKLREALGQMQQNELSLRMRYLSEWIRRGLGAYAWLREAPVTEGLNQLAEQTREAQAAVGQGQEESGDMESALARVEELRNELERLARGERPTRRTPGQAGQQQGQGGQRGQGEGMQMGQRQPDGEGGGRTYRSMNRGDRTFDGNGRAGDPLSPEDYRALERSYREGVRDLSQLRRSMRDSEEASAEIADLIRDMQQLDPSRFKGNPELVEELRTQVLPGLEQVELRLRREIGGGADSQAKSVISRPVPPGYAEAVAEYYRRLSEDRE